MKGRFLAGFYQTLTQPALGPLLVGFDWVSREREGLLVNGSAREPAQAY